MKRLLIGVVVAMLIACEDGKVKVDQDKLEEAGKELQHSVEKGVDTIGSKLKELKEKLDRKDTIIKDTVTY